MDGGIYAIGSRMHGLTENLECVAANLANASTPGYKRAVPKFRLLLHGMAGRSAIERGASCPRCPDMVGPELDLSQGPIRLSGRPLDVAVKGSGFLVVETPRGQRFTRKGRLYTNESGELVDGQGNRFASDGGSLSIPDRVESISIERDGQIVCNGQGLGKLMLMEVPRPDLLVAEGHGLYRNDGPPAESATGAEVIQGAIEQSNVKPMHELVALVQVMRAYEAGARVAKRMDALNSQLIKTAG